MKKQENHCRSSIGFRRACTLGVLLRIFAMLLLASFALYPTTAQAYVGPGAGLTMIGSAIALIVVILVALAGLIIWPIRALRQRKKGKPGIQK